MNAQPLKVLEFTGKKHLTKKEKEERRKAEIKIGDSKLAEPTFVRSDPAAHKKWKEIVKLYKSASLDIVTSADIGHLARYCKEFSEYLQLIARRENIANIEPFKYDEEELIQEELEGKLGARRAGLMWDKINYIMSIGGLLQIDKAINAKMSTLLQMEDRLFLNPLAKVKNVLKTTGKEPEDPDKGMFGE